MQRPLARLTVLTAVVAAVVLASCQADSPTGAIPEQPRVTTRGGSSADSIPGDPPSDPTPPNTDSVPPDPIPTDPPPTSDPAPTDSNRVESFDLTVTAVGLNSATDTVSQVAVRSARVTLFRFAEQPNDTSTPDAVIGDVVTDANGRATFQRLKAAWYRITVEPPKDSPFLSGTEIIPPAGSPQVAVKLLLPRTP